MNMLLKSLFILFLAVAADKGKGKGNRQRGGDKEKGRGKGKGKGRGCGDLDATRVQGDMTELLKAFIAGNSETTYCRIRGRGYPFVDVPTSTTGAPQRRILEQKKSATSFKVVDGEVATGLVQGCDDNTYCFPDITLSLTDATDDWTVAPASPRRNLGRRRDDDETVDTSSTETVSTEEPVATTATITFSQSNPGESFSMAYTCAVDYEAETSTTESPDGGMERSTTCTPKGLKCGAKFTVDSDDKRAYMMCSSTLSDDNSLEAVVDSCALPTSS